MKDTVRLTESALSKVMLVSDEHATGTVNGPEIDTQNYNQLKVIVNSGVNAASSTWDIKLQECDVSGGTFTDITGAAFTQITTANDNTIYVANLRCANFQRYIRAVSVVAVDVVSGGITCELSGYDGLAPVTQDNTIAFSLDYL